MTLAARLLLVTLLVLTSCVQVRDRARDAAVTTFRVIDTPARYVRDRIDPPQTTTTTTTTAEASSDVVTPGRPLPPQQAQGSTQQRVTPTTGASPPPRTTPRPSTGTTAAATPRPSSTPAASTQATDFPTAKAVPGKPGFVLSPYDGAYVDVTGFKSGDKARDPKTRQIFIVP